MWVGVLGPLEVRDGDRLIPIRGTIRTSLLAALVCRAPQVVLARQLIEDLWGPNPPRSAEKTLQSHLVRLRRELGSEGSCILTSGSGYRIDAERTGIDAHQFADAVESVRGHSRRDSSLRDSQRQGTGPLGRLGRRVPMWPAPSSCWTRHWIGGAEIRTPISPMPHSWSRSGSGSRNCACAPKSGGLMPRWPSENLRAWSNSWSDWLLCIRFAKGFRSS